MLADLSLTMPIGPTHPVAERRRWPRFHVAWPVTVSINESHQIRGYTVDASRHGLRVRLADASHELREGTACRVTVHLAGGEAHFVRVGDIRHAGDGGVGIGITKALPLNVQYVVGAGPRPGGD